LPSRSTAGRVTLAALVIGGLYAINSWDLPTYAVIYLAAGALPLFVAGRTLGRREWGTAGLFAVGCLAFYLPFYARFTSLVGGQPFDLPEPLASLPLIPKLSTVLGVVLWGKTPTDQFFIVYALPWIVGILFLTWRWWEGRKGAVAQGYTQPILIVLALALVATIIQMPVLFFAGTLLLLTGAIIRQGHTPRPNGPGRADADLFAVALFGAAFALVLATEVFFIHDVFGNRMNTIFKVYYQAWTLLAVAAGYAIVRVVTFRPRLRADLWRLPASGAVVLLLIATLGYPIFGSRARTEEFKTRDSLDGLAFVRDVQPEEWAGITWVRDHVPAGAVVAEAPGCSYGELYGMPHDRVSAFAGVDTPLGWGGHESQWRGGSPALLAALGPRGEDVNRLYSTTDPAEMRAIMDRYNIQYIYVGTFERHGYGAGGIGSDCTAGGNYPADGLAKFDTLLNRVFTSENGAVACTSGKTEGKYEVRATKYEVRQCLVQFVLRRSYFVLLTVSPPPQADAAR
jgi:YYY domain-containing protein